MNTQISAAAVTRLKTLCAKEKPGHLSDLLREAEEVMTDEVKAFIRMFTHVTNTINVR